MGAKPEGTCVPPTFLPGRDINAFVPPNLCTTQSQSSVIKFSSFVFFYHLKSVIQTWDEREDGPPNIFARGHTNVFPPTFS